MKDRGGEWGAVRDVSRLATAISTALIVASCSATPSPAAVRPSAATAAAASPAGSPSPAAAASVPASGGPVSGKPISLDEITGRIAFAFDDGIWVSDADGSNRHRLTHDGGFDPTWSPDGSRIAYRLLLATDDGEIWVMNGDGSHAHDLVNDPGPATSGSPLTEPGQLPDVVARWALPSVAA